ncbi:hypothetical protein H9Q69_012982 [Fusarium xylarioides]|nr:hypothetical protein H9Q69_012982 [Fusarium xylarioides]
MTPRNKGLSHSNNKGPSSALVTGINNDPSVGAAGNGVTTSVEVIKVKGAVEFLERFDCVDGQEGTPSSDSELVLSVFDELHSVFVGDMGE